MRMRLFAASINLWTLVSLLALCSGVALCEEAGPKTYYVSPSGADTNDGTSPRKSWKTLARVNEAALHPGDSVLLEGGQSFPGNLLIAASGNATAFITIGSHGAGQATILAGDSFGIRLQNCQYIKVRDLILTGSDVKPNGATTNNAQGLDIFSSIQQGPPWRGIYVDKLTISGFRDGIVLHTPIAKQNVVGYNDVRVTNCTIKECLVGGFYCWGSKKASGKPWGDPGLPLGNGVFTNCYLGGCVIHDIYGDPDGFPVVCMPIQIFNATSFLVERCTIFDCGQAALPKNQPGGMGGLVFLECDKSIAQYNECYRMVTKLAYDGCAFDIDGGCSNCVLQYNYSHDNEGSGFQTGTFAGSGPVTDNVIRYNISQNDTKKNPGNSGGIMTWSSQKNGHIHNNTVFISAGLDGNPAAFLGSGSGLTVSDNIFVVSHDGDIVRGGAGSTFRNNCYYRTKGDFSVTYANKHYTSLAAWREATGQETLNGAPLGFSADPQFKMPGGGASINDATKLGTLSAYDLRVDSPLLGKGLDLQALFKLAPCPSDFRGTPLPAGAKLDLGAIQRQ